MEAGEELGTATREAAKGHRWEEMGTERMKGTHDETHKDMMV